MLGIRRCGGFTMVEIILVMAVIAILAGIALPNMLRARITAHETAVTQSLRTLAESLESYLAVNATYPTDWDAQMYPSSGTAAYGPEPFNLDLDGGAQIVGPYSYQYVALPAGCGPCTSYDLRADPTEPGQTGTRHFLMDETTTIWHCTGEAGESFATKSDSTIVNPAAAC